MDNASFLYLSPFTETFTSKSINLTHSKVENYLSTRFSLALSFTFIFSFELLILLWSELKILETRLTWSSLTFSYLNNALDTWPVSSLMSFSFPPLWNNLKAYVTLRQRAVFFFISTAEHKCGNFIQRVYPHWNLVKPHFWGLGLKYNAQLSFQNVSHEPICKQ